MFCIIVILILLIMMFYMTMNFNHKQRPKHWANTLNSDSTHQRQGQARV